MTIYQLTPSQARKLFAADHEKTVMIDVREQSERDAEHIADTHFMPMSSFSEKNIDNILAMNPTHVIFQCRSGRRSDDVAAAFINHPKVKESFNGKVYNLTGGILAWNEQ